MRKSKVTREQYKYLVSLPYEEKLKIAEDAIRAFVREYGTSGVYVGYSGGKDSEVTLHMTRHVLGYKQIRGANVDTHLEWPSLRQHVRKHENIDIIKPKVFVKDIVEKYGYCFPSKEVAMTIEAARNFKGSGPNIYELKLLGLDKNGNRSIYRTQYRKWMKLYESDIPVSNMCCVLQKEMPLQEYEKEKGVFPILGTRATESGLRRTSYLRTGCNTFLKEYVYNEENGNYDVITNSRAVCRPLSIFTDQDIYRYQVTNNILFAPPYGDTVHFVKKQCYTGSCENCSGCKYETTGEERTGCLFCPVGLHLKSGYDKFQHLRKENETLYEYVMEELNVKRIVAFVEENFRVK